MVFNYKTQLFDHPQSTTYIWNLQTRLAHLSDIAENLPFKSGAVLSIFFIMQSLLQVILPSLLLTLTVVPLKGGIDRILDYINVSSLRQVQQGFAFHLFLLLLLSITLSVTLLVKDKHLLRLTVIFFTVHYTINSILILIQIKGMAHFINSKGNDIIIQFERIIFIVICFLNIMLCLLICLIFRAVHFKHSITKDNDICGRITKKMVIIDLLVKVLSVISSILLQIYMGREQVAFQRLFIGLYIFILMYIVSIKLSQQLSNYTYLSSRSSKIYRQCLMFSISIIIICFIQISIQSELLTANSLITMFSISIFLTLSVETYMKSKNQSYLLRSLSEIETGQEATFFVIELTRFLFQYEKLDQGQNFLLMNLWKQHEKVCKDVQCFCKTDINNSGNQLEVYRLLTINIMENLRRKFLKSIELQQTFSSLNLHFFQNYLNQCQFIRETRDKKIDFLDSIFNIKYSISLRNLIKSKEKELHIIKTEKFIESEKLMNDTIKLLVTAIKLRASFWLRIKKGIVNTEMESNIDSLIQNMKNTFEINDYILNNYSSNAQLIGLVAAYQKFVLLKDRFCGKLRQCLQKIRTNTNTITLVSKIHQTGSIQSMLLSPQSCSIVISLRPQKIGIIMHVSKSCSQLFSYLPQQLLHSHINMLIPNQMTEEHNRILQNWLHKSSWENVGTLRNIYCANKEKICFKSWFYLKFIMAYDQIQIVGSFLKDNNRDYMVLSDNFQIITAGIDYMDLLGKNIIGFPLKYLCENVFNLRNWVDDGKPHCLRFYSTKGKEQFFIKYHEKKFEIDRNTDQFFDKLQQLKINYLSQYVLQLKITSLRVGRLTFFLLKLSSQLSHNDKQTYSEVLSNNLPSIHSEQFHEQNRKKMLLNIDLDTSVSSCQASRNILAYDENIFQIMTELFYGQRKVRDAKVIKVIIFIIVFVLGGIYLNLFKLSVNQQGFQQMQQLFFADGACSDNLQITMFIFNKGITINRLIKSTIQKNLTSQSGSQFFKDLQQLNYEKSYLYNLIAREIEGYNQDVTSINKLPMHSYQNKQVNWIQADLQQMMVQTTSFMTNFIYLGSEMSRISSQILVLPKSSPSIPFLYTILRSLLKTMHLNFATLQKLNLDNLNYYSDLLQKTKSSLLIFTYIKFSLSIIFLSIILIIINVFGYLKFSKFQKMYQVYTMLNREAVETFLKYFVQLKILIDNEMSAANKKHSRRKLSLQKTIQKISQTNINILPQKEQKNMFLVSLNQATYNTNPNTMKIQSPYKITLLNTLSILIFIFILGLNITMMLTQSDILNQSSEIIQSINGLMNSENQLVGMYFQSKYHYGLKDEIQTHNIPISDWLENLGRAEVQFGRIAANSIQILSTYDPDYTPKMIKVLTENVCSYTKSLLPEMYYENCDKNSETSNINQGVINSMNYFSRQLLSSLIEISNRANASLVLVLPKIDKTIFYMFKMYQQTQSAITVSLLNVLNSRNQVYIIQIYVQILIMLSFLGYAVQFYRKENMAIQDLIGRVLILPRKVFDSKNRILTIVNQALGYDGVVQVKFTD